MQWAKQKIYSLWRKIEFSSVFIMTTDRTTINKINLSTKNIFFWNKNNSTTTIIFVKVFLEVLGKLKRIHLQELLWTSCHISEEVADSVLKYQFLRYQNSTQDYRSTLLIPSQTQGRLRKHFTSLIQTPHHIVAVA